METGDSQLLNEPLKAYCSELRKRKPLGRGMLLVKGPQLNLTSFEQDVARNRCYYAYPPTGLQYLASAIGHRGLDVKIIDLNYEFLKRVNTDPSFDPRFWITLLDEPLKERPSLVGVSNLFSVDTPGFMEILYYLKTREDKPIILVGGQNATYNGQKLLEEGLCDFVFEREAEDKLNYFLDVLYEVPNPNPLQGINFKYNGRIERTKGKPKVVELKGDLIDAHKLVKVEDYCQVGTLSPYSRMVGKDTPFATVLFNRGCEGGCKFCGVCDYMGKGVRSRTVDDFLNELEYLVREHGIRHFELLDDDFARYKDRAMEVLKGIINRGLKLTWSSNNGFIARTIDEELMIKMRDSGCIGFKIGVESGNPEILRFVRKPGNITTFRRFSEIAKRFPEMFIADNYIIGFPTETFGQMRDSFRFSLEMNLDWSNYAVYQHNVNSFGDKASKTSNEIGDFIPTKDTKRGKLDKTDSILRGPAVFNLSSDSIPSREQLSQIWFSFNLLRNFIGNKNLQEGGRPDKFLSWVGVVEERYPTHPYMNFFSSLGHCLQGNENELEMQYKRMIKNLLDAYWEEVFREFNMDQVVSNFPRSRIQAREAIAYLIDQNIPK